MFGPRAPDDRPAVDFAVVGEHRADPDRLLLLGDDGRFYGVHLPAGPLVPVEPDADEWAVDLDLPPAADLFA